MVETIPGQPQSCHPSRLLRWLPGAAAVPSWAVPSRTAPPAWVMLQLSRCERGFIQDAGAACRAREGLTQDQEASWALWVWWSCLLTAV